MARMRDIFAIIGFLIFVSEVFYKSWSGHRDSKMGKFCFVNFIICYRVSVIKVVGGYFDKKVKNRGGNGMFCSNCGSKIEEETNFCPFCGASQRQESTGEAGTTKMSTNSSMDELKAHIEKGKRTGNLYKIVGWVSTVISLFFFPIIFGALAIIMGYLYRDHNEKEGTIIIIAGVAFALTGFFLGYGTPVYY